MNIKALHPPTPGQVADWSDVAGLQAKMVEAIEAMEAMADDVGMAQHIAAYDTEQRKKALARAMSPALAGGASAVAAEAEARASESYAKELAMLAKVHLAAEQTTAQWTAKKLVWETARSLLSLQRETVKHL